MSKECRQHVWLIIVGVKSPTLWLRVPSLILTEDTNSFFLRVPSFPVGFIYSLGGTGTRKTFYSLPSSFTSEGVWPELLTITRLKVGFLRDRGREWRKRGGLWVHGWYTVPDETTTSVSQLFYVGGRGSYLWVIIERGPLPSCHLPVLDDTGGVVTPAPTRISVLGESVTVVWLWVWLRTKSTTPVWRAFLPSTDFIQWNSLSRLKSLTLNFRITHSVSLFF